MRKRIAFWMHPNVMSKQLGADMYSPPEALKQLVANALDANSSRVDIELKFNELEAPEQVTIEDDGVGIAPQHLEAAMGKVGIHTQAVQSKRETIGTRGIGRFAVFSLGVQAFWKTVALTNDDLMKQEWVMEDGQTALDIELQPASRGERPGTSIRIILRQTEGVKRLFQSVATVKRAIFNSFAGYLTRYEGEVDVYVNDEPVHIHDYVDEQSLERIGGSEDVPEGTLRHMVLSPRIDQPAQSILVFATHGTTIKHEVLGDEGIPRKKYLGLVDSAYLSDLTNTGKSDLAEFDQGFRALRSEASSRASQFIQERQQERGVQFLEEARKKSFYPYREPPKSPVDTYRRQLYDGLLLTLEEQYRIADATAKQQELIFALTRKLMQSEDLASVLTEVLGLKGEEVARFASLLRRTSLGSVIAVADLLVDRIRFLDELHVLVYGNPSKYVQERRHLHKVIEGHTWLFGEQYHLMGSDQSIKKTLERMAADLEDSDDPEAREIVHPELRLIPDLWMASTKWNEGAKYRQHLVVELKRPSVLIVPSHVDKLRRYSAAIVNSPEWSQRPNSHRFTFVVVSSDVSESVKQMYQEDEEPGLFSRPSLDHPTELWALRWSDYLDRRREELNYLEKEIEITADPELLEYLKQRVGEYLPEIE